jgi:hypothetical protein
MRFELPLALLTDFARRVDHCQNDGDALNGERRALPIALPVRAVAAHRARGRVPLTKNSSNHDCR